MKKHRKMKIKIQTIRIRKTITLIKISLLTIQKSFIPSFRFRFSTIMILLFFGLSITFTGGAWGQTTYYYISGNHNTVGNWNTNPAGGGTAASSFAGASDIFIVPTGKTTVCNGGMAIANKLRIEGTLTQSSVSTINAKYWEIASGGIVNTSAGGGLTVASNETFLCAGTVDRTGSASITFNSEAAGTIQNGGVWHHDELAGGSIPAMTWETGSTCRITKTASTASVITAASLAQEFYNLEWNYTCSGNQIFETNIPTFKSGGTFTIKNSGTGIIALGNSSTSISMTVPNLRIEGGTFAIKGSSSTAVNTLNISNTFIQTGGTFTLNRVNSAVNIPILNIAGNFECSGGTFNNNANASATASVNFTKSGTQTFTLGGTIANGIEFTVNNGSTLEFATNATVLSNSSTNCKFTVASGGGLIIKCIVSQLMTLSLRQQLEVL